VTQATSIPRDTLEALLAAATQQRTIQYDALPTLAQLHQDRDLYHHRLVMGPFGSGKSVAMVMELFVLANQFPPCRDGVRRSRWAIIRSTYGQLLTTTLKTWEDWLPASVVRITRSAPIQGTFIRKCDDGTTVDAEFLFFPLDKPKDVERVLSMDLSGVWLNEARAIPWSVVEGVFARTGRYPPAAMMPDDWRGSRHFLADSNPPDTEHWWYRLAEKEQPAGWKFYRQPAALVRELDGTYSANPLAENVKNHALRYRYWQDMIAGHDQEWINVHVLGEYGNIFEGRPVYDGYYRDAVHCSPTPLGIYTALPIHLGWDFGLTPACVVSQVTPKGRVHILRTFASEGSGLRQFCQDVVRPALAQDFSQMRIISRCDPAGAARSQADEHTCVRELELQGIPTTPAATNDFIPRRAAVINVLTRMIDGEPALLIDPSCHILREGFRGGYQFSRVAVVGQERYRDEPLKNHPYSDVHDALQYILLDLSTPVTMQTPRRQAEPQRGGWGAYR
jgi:hypothetical protein